jgi:integrase
MNGSIRKRSKGTWQMRYDAPPDGTGKRRYVSETVHGNKKDAERILRERLATIENGGYVPCDKETVAAFLDRWLKTYAASNTTLRTQEGYRGNIERYINPSIGGIPLQNLTGRHIQGMYAEMLERGLSARTTLHVHRVLRKALADAMRWGLLSRNAADAATPPRPERKQTDMWDAETIDQFLAAAEDSRFRDLYKLAVWTGMRRSELAGLKWDHVDLVTCRLSVVATLQRILGRGLVEGQPKTPRSRRSIALAPEAIELLHGIRGRQIEQRLDYGDLRENAGYVFAQDDGKPINPPSVSKDFGIIVRNVGLPHLTLHGLRHAHATLALTAGVNPKIVSERLGHSSIAVTMDVYSHVLPGMQEQAAQAVEELLSQARRDRLGTN